MCSQSFSCSWTNPRLVWTLKVPVQSLHSSVNLQTKPAKRSCAQFTSPQENCFRCSTDCSSSRSAVRLFTSAILGITPALLLVTLRGMVQDRAGLKRIRKYSARLLPLINFSLNHAGRSTSFRSSVRARPQRRIVIGTRSGRRLQSQRRCSKKSKLYMKMVANVPRSRQRFTPSSPRDGHTK